MKISLSFLARAAALAVSVLTVSTGALAQDPGPVVVYNAQHASLTRAWVDGFTRETGIKVVVRNGEDAELGNQLVQEGKASPADVFLTENSPAMTLVDNAGLFAPLDPATLAQVPANFRPANGHWTGIAARSTVFVYNKLKVSRPDLPRSVMDLSGPAWKGRWGAAAAGPDFQAIVSAILELKGEPATADWLRGMKANFKSYNGNSAVMKAVNAGEIDGGLIYHYYYLGDQARTGENSDKVGLYYFRNQDPGAFVSISGGGVLASSKRPAQAQALVKWIAGKGGQDILRTGTSYEYAVGQGAASNRNLVPLNELQYPAVEPSRLNSRKVTDLMTKAGLL